MNAVERVWDQAAPTAAAKQAAKDSEPPTRGQGLYENWIGFLKQLKQTNESPLLVFARTLKFYRDNVDRNVGFDLRILDKRIFAYKLSDRFGWVNFFTVDGLWIRFMWLHDLNTVAVYFNHLADPEVVE